MTSYDASAALLDRLSSIETESLRASAVAMRHNLKRVVESFESAGRPGWAEKLSMLRSVGRVDLCLARLFEGHVDAARVLFEAGVEPAAGVYGVWASRSAGTGLKAVRIDGLWELSGQLRFASGIDLIDRALVLGWLDGDHHLLFDVSAADLTPDRESWSAAAMDASRSFAVECNGLAVTQPVGDTDFYLNRPGFVVGGIGPAAVWSGGAHHIADLVATQLRAFTPTPHQRRRLGVIEQAIWTADAALEVAITAIETVEEEEVAAAVTHARATVANACDLATTEAPIIVGPGGLSTSRRLSRALADVEMYVRQHHLDSVWEALGTQALSRREVIAG